MLFFLQKRPSDNPAAPTAKPGQDKPDVVPAKPEVKVAEPETLGPSKVTNIHHSDTEIDDDRDEDDNGSEAAAITEQSTNNLDAETSHDVTSHNVESRDQNLTNVVFTPGPYSSVNKVENTRIRLLPGYLKSETMEEMWKPVPNTKLGKFTSIKVD